jgi:uncharacterized alkaline shock family protein YloU
MTEYRSAGKTTLTPDVLLTIARESALEVDGVNRMAPVKGGVNSLKGHGHNGVRMVVEDSTVIVDLYLVLDQDVNIREVSRTVQQSVARAIAEMTGLDVGLVNIHIEDVHYKAEV